jgi:hypothetical protein
VLVQQPPFLFVETTPHTMALADRQRVPQAGLGHDAHPTDRFGLLGLQARQIAVSHWEEQLGVDRPTGGPETPIRPIATCCASMHGSHEERSSKYGGRRAARPLFSSGRRLLLVSGRGGDDQGA